MTVRLELPPPPTRAPGGSGDDGCWVQLTVAADDIDAHLLCGRLSVAGIETRGVKDRSSPGAWIYGGANPWAPVAVFVRRFALLDARMVLAEIAYEGPPASRPSAAGACRRPRAWWAWALALGLLLTGLSLARTAQALSERFEDPCALQLICGGAQ